MGFSSKDRDLTELFRQCLGLTAAIRKRRRKRWGKIWTCYEISFSSVRLAHWFQDIGIMPRKSLILGALEVPSQLFFHALRGLIEATDRSLVIQIARAATASQFAFTAPASRIWCGFPGSCVISSA
jgi:hypothetical protein